MRRTFAFDPSLPGVISHLHRCRQARAEGERVAFTTDPTWLVHHAINRRAGWPEDPSTVRGTCKPTDDGRYPPRADGDRNYRNLRLVARRVNTPRLVVRAMELGDLRVRARLGGRLWSGEEG